MSYVLSIYSSKAFKEFLLPAINNANYSLILQKEIFHLETDLEIYLEVINNEWHFVRRKEYSIVCKEQDYFDETLTNGALLTIALSNGTKISIVVKITDSSFAVYQKYDISNLHQITIGKSSENMIQYDSLGLVSREHAVIERKNGYFIIQDKSANGIFVNSLRVQGAWQLKFGDCIDVFGMRIVFLGTILAINSHIEGILIKEQILNSYIQQGTFLDVKNQAPAEMKIFRRSPRLHPPMDTEPIEIEAPPTPKELQQQPLSMVIGPAMTMALPMLLGCGLAIYSTRASGSSGSAFMYTGLITAISSALVGTFWALRNMKYNKQKTREEELHRFEAYGEYLIKCTNQIREKYERNARILNELYRPAMECCTYGMTSSTLWNRNVTHEDFLKQRIGIGSLPFQAKINVPKEKFTLINDSLAQKPQLIQEEYKTLHNVPVCIDLLEHKLIGILGGADRKGAHPIVHSLIAQIAACNCYTDVKLVFIYDERENNAEENWSFAKWLPHVWSEDKKTRFVAKNKTEASDVFYELTKILRNRIEMADSFSSHKEFKKPYYILIVENQEMLEGELIAKYIFENKEEYGFTTLLLEETYDDLPNACDYIIENDYTFTGMYGTTDDDMERTKIQFDNVSSKELEIFSRCLANIEVNELETGGEIPNSLTFFDMYGVNALEELNVVERWLKNRTYDTMRAVIGQKAGGVPCYLDVHEKYHGPHGLIAGTTGSGKSETLQTYMLSLAINFSPDDIGFFVIDYKGGGMANLFSGLPHMIGQISNLSGNQVRRAMISIKSENMRRQRIFNEHGVNNINLYTRLYKNNEASIPIPHMFIVIDEFAELKREEPDFMRELISVAQVGRSLGVHLILATQKPSGTVDDNIWSNSKFRLCLRVQDRQDSTDMLHKPDAAYITQAGRCYMQVGNDELYELFQSGWSGATYDEEQGNNKTDIAKMLSITGKAALVGNRTKLRQKEQAKQHWIALLLQIIILAENEGDYKVIECVNNAVDMAAFIKRVFVYFEKNKIEYAETEYNSHRVEDLIKKYVTWQQNGWTGDLNDAAAEIIKMSAADGTILPEMKERTQLDAVVEYLGQVAKENHYTHNLQLWLPVLPEQLYLNQLEGYGSIAFHDNHWMRRTEEWSLETMIGLYDDPANQIQRPLIMNLGENGHHAICGTVSSGKSTFLQTFLFSLLSCYTPEMINVYAIDFSSKMLSAFEGAAQVGGIMYENDDEKLDKFFNMMSNILDERKQLLRGGSYSQYVQANGIKIPAIVLVIDNYANFRSKTNNRYEDMLLQLSRDGVGHGIFMVISSAGFGALDIPTRIGDNMKTVICLEMSDKFQYADALRTLRIEVLPEIGVRGRGLASVGGAILEFQTALSVQAEDDYKRSEKIQEYCMLMNEAWNGKRARKIPEIPEKPLWKEYAELDEVQHVLSDDRRLPIGYDLRNAEIYGLDLSRTYCYLLSGAARTGKTNLLKLMINSAKLKQGELVVIDFNDELGVQAEKNEAEYITNDAQLFEFCDRLLPKFKERNQVKKSCIQKGMSDEEIFIEMSQFERIMIFIASLPDFVEHVYKPSEGVGEMAGFLENLTDKGSLHNVFWFACYNQSEIGRVAGKKVFDNFAKYKNGIHLGGNVAAQKILNFDYIPYIEQTKAQKTGVGMLPSVEDELLVEKVVIPLVKGE